MDLRDVALGILHVVHISHDVGRLQPHRTTGCQAEPLLVDALHFEVVGFDEQLPAERQLAGSRLRVFRIVLCGQPLDLALRIIGHHKLDRTKHRHRARGNRIQVVAQCKLQQPHVDDVVPLGHPDAVAELTDAFRGVPTSTQSADRGHPGIVPAIDHTVFHQPKQLPLRHDGVVQIQPRKLPLFGRENAQAFDVPVVQRPMVLKLQGAQAVRDALDAVRLAMGKVVHGIDAPGISRTMVMGKFDSVHERVAHVHVGMRHVNLGAQHHASFWMLSLPHFLEQPQVLSDGAVAKWARGARLRGRAFLRGDVLCRLFIHVGLAILNQLDSVAVQRLEVITGVVLASVPFKT